MNLKRLLEDGSTINPLKKIKPNRREVINNFEMETFSQFDMFFKENYRYTASQDISKLIKKEDLSQFLQYNKLGQFVTSKNNLEAYAFNRLKKLYGTQHIKYIIIDDQTYFPLELIEHLHHRKPTTIAETLTETDVDTYIEPGAGGNNDDDTDNFLLKSPYTSNDCKSDTNSEQKESYGNSSTETSSNTVILKDTITTTTTTTTISSMDNNNFSTISTTTSSPTQRRIDDFLE